MTKEQIITEDQVERMHHIDNDSIPSLIEIAKETRCSRL